MTPEPQLSLALVQHQRRRHAAKHADEIAVWKERVSQWARERGEYGVTIGEWRAKFGISTRKDKSLSWTVALLPGCGLVKAGRRRLSPLPGTRNLNECYVLPEFVR